MEDVVVTKHFIGLLYMQACVLKTLTDEQILEAANKLNPCGTSKGWCYVVRDKEELNPVQCLDHPDRQHLILGC
jgi:hypothetical protein